VELTLSGVLPHLQAVVSEIEDTWRERFAVRQYFEAMSWFLSEWVEDPLVELPERSNEDIKAFVKSRDRVQKIRERMDTTPTAEELVEAKKPKTYLSRVNYDEVLDVVEVYLIKHPLTRQKDIAGALDIPRSHISGAIKRDRMKVNPRLGRFGKAQYYVNSQFDPVKHEVIDAGQGNGAGPDVPRDRDHADTGSSSKKLPVKRKPKLKRGSLNKRSNNALGGK